MPFMRAWLPDQAEAFPAFFPPAGAVLAGWVIGPVPGFLAPLARRVSQSPATAGALALM